MKLNISHKPLFLRSDIQAKFEISDYKYVCTSATYKHAIFCQDIYYTDNLNSKTNSHYIGFFELNNTIIMSTNVDNIEQFDFILFSNLDNTYHYSRYAGDRILFGDGHSNGRNQTWDNLPNKSNAILTRIKNGRILQCKS